MISNISLDKIVIDCGSVDCSVKQWQDPVTVIQGPFWNQWWFIVIVALVTLATIVAIAIVRYRRHERLEDERRRELDAQVAMTKERKSCHMCGAVYDPQVQ